MEEERWMWCVLRGPSGCFLDSHAPDARNRELTKSPCVGRPDYTLLARNIVDSKEAVRLRKAFDKVYATMNKDSDPVNLF